MINYDLPTLAIETGRQLALTYDGHSRVVEVHAVGVSTAGNPCMRVYQVSGGSNSGKLGWKMMTLDKVTGTHLTDEGSAAPREGYAKNDRGMSRIVSQV